MTAAQVKMALETKALQLAVTITGVHSVVLLADGTLDVVFDIVPDECASGLHFVCTLPLEVGFDEADQFSRWLAEPDCLNATLH